MEVFGTQARKEALAFELVRSGAFRKASQTPMTERNALLIGLLGAGSLQAFSGWREGLTKWLKTERTAQSSSRLGRKDLEDDRDNNQRKRKGKVPNVRSKADVPVSIDRQKDAIKAAIRDGNGVQTREFVEDLIRYQSSNSNPEQLAKSLCDLAQHAKNCGWHKIQLELASRAVEISPGDAWSLAQLGDARLLAGLYTDALAAYDLAWSHGAGAIARTGRAEVLKAQGRLDEALAAYESVVRDFPQDAVARNGRAEVLKTQGRFDEALAAYESVVRDFPQNAVARTGRAEVLKAQGRFDEALAAYESVVRDFPQNAFGQTGRAEVLKAQGRLDEALAAYESVIKDFPRDAVARTGRAEVLKAQGRFDEALQAYESVVRDFPQNAVARTGRAEVLKVQGRLDEALAAYESVVRDFAQNAFARTGLAEVLKAQGRLDEALAAYESVVSDFPQNAVGRTGRAEVLKAQGRFNEALAAYESVVKDFPQDAVARGGLASVHILCGRHDKALSMLDPSLDTPNWIHQHMIGTIRLRQGHIQSAIEIFERGVQQADAVQRRYFRSSLGYARLLARQPLQALEDLADDRSLVSNVIRLDIFGQLKQVDKAREVYASIRANQAPRVIELAGELAARARIIPAVVATHPTQWVLDREFELLLAA